MITDELNTFASAEATGNVGSNVVGDVIDLEDLRDIGAGKQVFLNVLADVDITAGAGGTYQVKLVTSANSDLSSSSDLIVSAELDSENTVDAGTVIINQALPMEGTAYKRYIGIVEVVGTANTTAGAINAFLSLDERSYKSYAQGEVGY